jgi:hypothetical protein
MHSRAGTGKQGTWTWARGLNAHTHTHAQPVDASGRPDPHPPSVAKALESPRGAAASSASARHASARLTHAERAAVVRMGGWSGAGDLGASAGLDLGLGPLSAARRPADARKG